MVDVEAHCLFLEGRYFFARGTPEALAQAKTCFEHAVERDARFAQAFDSLAELWWWLGIMMYLQHAPLRMIEEAHELSGGIPFTLGFLAYAYGRAGRRGDARGLLDHAQTAAADAYVPPSTLALGYVGLDEWDDAFDWWDRAIECRDPLIIPIKTFPFFDPVRGEHRYLEMLRRMNLPVD